MLLVLIVMTVVKKLLLSAKVLVLAALRIRLFPSFDVTPSMAISLSLLSSTIYLLVRCLLKLLLILLGRFLWLVR